LLLKRADMRLRWNTSGGGPTFGRLRGAYDGIAGTNCLVNILVLPFGQGSPLITYDAEHIVVQLEGRVEWETGGERLVLEPEDMLFIPPATPYRFLNVGRGDATFLDVAARADVWPATITYLDEA
jgi:mannose-6-phosphate isomerase-like protein (cupin superfamily)